MVLLIVIYTCKLLVPFQVYQVRKWFHKNKEGIRVYVTEILVETYQQMEFLPKEQKDTENKEQPAKQSTVENLFNSIYRTIDIKETKKIEKQTGQKLKFLTCLLFLFCMY